MLWIVESRSKNVLRRFRNESMVLDERMQEGREFQIVGCNTKKREPKDRIVRGIC